MHFNRSHPDSKSNSPTAFWIHLTKSGVLCSVKASHFKSNIAYPPLSFHSHCQSLISKMVNPSHGTSLLQCHFAIPPISSCWDTGWPCVLIWPIRSDGVWLTDLGLKGSHCVRFCLLGCQPPSQEARIRLLTDERSCGGEMRGSANSQQQGPKHVSAAILDLPALIKPTMVIFCIYAIQYGSR